MDSRTTPTPPPARDVLAAMLQNASIETAERSEFSNTARDTFRFVLNYNPNSIRSGAGPENADLEFHDAMNYLLNAVPFFLEEVRKNDQDDQSRSTVTQTAVTDPSVPITHTSTTDQTPHSESSNMEDQVDVIDIVPPEPSSLPVTSIADRYTRSMLKCLVGYPLYNPKPFCELSNEYVRKGVNVGDVGFVRENGTFDFLFNICPLQNGSINPPNLPDGFYLDASDHSETMELEPLPVNSSLFKAPVSKAKSCEYICEGNEGAVLELPEGAIGEEATKIYPFEMLATRHGVKWYEHTISRGRKISNGSLYLITSSTKCSQWGIAVFDQPCVPGQGLRFENKRSLPFGKSTPKYQWKGTRTFSTKVYNPDQMHGPNQCVFVRGYKIMIRQDIFDDLCKDQLRKFNSATTSPPPQAGINMTRQRATRIRGGGGPDPLSRVIGSLFSETTTMKSNEEVVLQANFSSSLVHPSDLINVALLSQHPGAKIAVTHDDVWCDLLRDNFPKLDYGTLANVARLYTTTNDEYDRVCLKKISETLQRPVTISRDNLTCPPAPLTLPRELVERILLFLDTESILTCRLVDRAFNEIIQSSTILQYLLACKAAGVVDNPQSPLSYAERLEALNRREEAWRQLKPVFETTIKVNDQLGQTSKFYDLAAGNFFLSDKDRKDLYCCHLPSSPHDNLEWTRVPGDGPGQSWSGFIVTTAMAIYEHDLMVKVISSEVAGTRRHSLDLVLLKFSTGGYHPLARHPRIHVQQLNSAMPFVHARIVGDNIALIVGSYHGTFPENLFIFDWQTGHKRLEHETTEDAYSSLIFVSTELLLVPNYALSHFEVWYLSRSPNPPTQILSLQIPAISDGYSISGIYCHGEPGPFLLSMKYFPPRPFFPSPEDSIIISNFQFRSQSAYALIMHSGKLLAMIQKLASPPFLERPQDPTKWSGNEVIVDQVVDPDDPRSVRLSAKSKVILTHNAPTNTTHQMSPTSTISGESGSSSTPSGPSSASTASSTSRYGVPLVQWKDWGPPISRWFQMNSDRAWRTYRSNGQRYAFLAPNHRISVADFNPHNIRRNTSMMERFKKGGSEDNSEERGNGSNAGNNDESEEVEFEILEHEGVFSEEVHMSLKCIVFDVQGEYNFDAVLMNEERLLGLKDDHHERLESVKVLYIG